jgi:hypothetical protein
LTLDPLDHRSDWVVPTGTCTGRPGHACTARNSSDFTGYEPSQAETVTEGKHVGKAPIGYIRRDRMFLEYDAKAS